MSLATVKPVRRFRIQRLEERIAPTQILLQSAGGHSKAAPTTFFFNNSGGSTQILLQSAGGHSKGGATTFFFNEPNTGHGAGAAASSSAGGTFNLPTV